MDVAHPFREIPVLLAHHRFVAVLKQQAVPVMAAIEPPGIAGQ
jgi:hypothetical protein